MRRSSDSRSRSGIPKGCGGADSRLPLPDGPDISAGSRSYSAVEHRIRDGSVDARAEQWLEWATDFLKPRTLGELLDDPWPTAPLRPATSMPWHWK